MPIRVLFVDDQPNVLAGLRRMLRDLRAEWDMEFVESGGEALIRMEEAPFDVVVSDMRMPDMDGAQLLTEVMNRFPATVRIILSGQADQVSIMRSITPAHQYLSKPCDTETLKATVARTRALRETLNEDSLKRLVTQITTIPSLPDVYMALVDELQAEDVSIRRIADLISRDVGMSAKLMQLVNSSFFGIPRHIESPAHAATLLGINLLKPLVLSAGIFSQFDETGLVGYSLETLMHHSLAVSRLAKEIATAQNESKESVEDALLAGLLHDIGQLVLAANLKSKYCDTLAHALESGMPLCEAEVECLGASHADVGAYLLGLWGMSDAIVEAVAFHHDPSRCPADGSGPLMAVHVANVLENEAEACGAIAYSLDLDSDYLRRLGVEDRLEEWREIAKNLHDERAQLT